MTRPLAVCILYVRDDGSYRVVTEMAGMRKESPGNDYLDGWSSVGGALEDAAKAVIEHLVRPTPSSTPPVVLPDVAFEGVPNASA